MPGISNKHSSIQNIFPRRQCFLDRKLETNVPERKERGERSEGQFESAKSWQNSRVEIFV